MSLVSIGCFSQNQFGIYSGYLLSMKSNGKGFIKDKYQIINDDQTYDGFRVSAFVKHSAKTGYWNFEMGYFQSQAGFFIINLKPQEEDGSLAPVWNVIDVAPKLERFDFAISRGAKLIRNFSGEIVIIAGYWLKDRLAGYSDDYFATESLKRSKVIYRLSDSYLRMSASAQIKLTYTFGPLQIILSHEQTITPLTKSVPFNGERYPFKQTYKNLALGLAYTVYNSKK